MINILIILLNKITQLTIFYIYDDYFLLNIDNIFNMLTLYDNIIAFDMFFKKSPSQYAVSLINLMNHLMYSNLIKLSLINISIENNNENIMNKLYELLAINITLQELELPIECTIEQYIKCININPNINLKLQLLMITNYDESFKILNQYIEKYGYNYFQNLSIICYDYDEHLTKYEEQKEQNISNNYIQNGKMFENPSYQYVFDSNFTKMKSQLCDLCKEDDFD